MRTVVPFPLWSGRIILLQREPAFEQTRIFSFSLVCLMRFPFDQSLLTSSSQTRLVLGEILAADAPGGAWANAGRGWLWAARCAGRLHPCQQMPDLSDVADLNG